MRNSASIPKLGLRGGSIFCETSEESLVVGNWGGSMKKRRSRNLGNVILMSRDLEIIEFILEMKFSSVQDVYERFFKVKLNGEKAVSDEWAMRRLQQLEKAGLLNGLHSFSERRKFYLVTIKGYQALRNKKSDFEDLKPSLKIDHRTFDHDKYVLEARIALENRLAASSWISDKRLRTNKELAGGLVNSNVPDGVYINEKGERVAFEFELSRKSNADYINKIKKYVEIMRSEAERKVFDKVIYVCAKSYAYVFLSRETRIYGELFEIIRQEDFFLTDENQSSTSLS